MFGDMKEKMKLSVNTNHPLAKKVLTKGDEEQKQAVLKQAFDLARLAQNMLEGKELTEFIHSNYERLMS